MEKIFIIFGTSDTVGFWDWEGGGWADRLKRYLMERGAKNKDEYFAPYNLGIDGDTTTGVLARLENEIKPRLWPDMAVVVIFDVGSNDAILIRDAALKTSVEAFTTNIRSLIAVARKYAQKIIFLDSFPVDESKTAPVPWEQRTLFYRNDRIREYLAIIKQIAKEESALFTDFRSEFERMNGEHLSEDGLHLNNRGHQKIFEIIKDFLLEQKII